MNIENLTIYYPSGMTATVRGELSGFLPELSGGRCVYPERHEDSVVVLDPRAVVVTSSGRIVTPEPELMGHDMKEWMKANPHWPGVLELASEGSSADER